VDGRLKTIWKDFTALWYIVSVCDKPLTCDKLLGLCDNPVAVIGWIRSLWCYKYLS